MDRPTIWESAGAMTLRDDMKAQARAILALNDRGGYTVPTAGLYPFQWNWDSAFVAMGFATYDVDRAFREMERLIEGQWADGMIPHIVFHQPSDTYFPGPDVWRTDLLSASARGGPRTSGITQPPVLGTALRYVYRCGMKDGRGDAIARTKALFKSTVANHRWWQTARDPDRTGVVAVLHNWETGSDNSPAWDEAFSRVPTTTTTVIKRKDTGHVDAAMRPTDLDYARYIHLVDAYAAVGWDAAKQWQIAPFKIAEVQMTAILLRATEDLLSISTGIGDADDIAFLEGQAKLLRAGLMQRYRADLGRFVSKDLITGADIETPTHAGFVPLAALDLEPNVGARVLQELRHVMAEHAVAVPSTPRWSPAFDSRRYWRGPVWLVINWLIADGLERNGQKDMALQVRRASMRAVETQGFAENFDPISGIGAGGASFSWTAAAYLAFADKVPAGA
jgi:hypothetical protein